MKDRWRRSIVLVHVVLFLSSATLTHGACGFPAPADTLGGDGSGILELPEVGRNGLATGMVGGMLAGSLVSSYYDWWKDNAEPFHLSSEGFFSDYSLGIDKLGHAFTSYFYFHMFHNIMEWGGFGPETSMRWAAGASVFFAVSVEIGDGLSQYGFSFEDLTFNLAGLAFGIAQVNVPFLRHFQLKWSYVPSNGYRWPPRFTDNYDAHTYWLTVDVRGLIPEDVLPWWPPCLNLALGYGVDDMQSKREFVFGLDLNLGAFEVSDPDLRMVTQTVSMFHIPAPAMKFTEEKAARFLPFHFR
jgi:hypothetical protein